MANALTVYQPKDLSEVKHTAELFAKSGMFDDAKQMAQAFVKIMAGGAMGFDPFASMNGIHIIQGKPSMGAGLIAAAIDRHTEYDYEVIEHTAQKCVIKFLKRRNGEWVQAGVSEFTMADASKAKVWNKKKGAMEALSDRATWKSYPRNMLYARAMSNGARWYCAGVFGGSVYTPEEMGAEVDEDGDIVDALVVEDIATPQTITILDDGKGNDPVALEEVDDQPDDDDADDLVETATEELGAEVAGQGGAQNGEDRNKKIVKALSTRYGHNAQKVRNRLNKMREEGEITSDAPEADIMAAYDKRTETKEPSYPNLGELLSFANHQFGMDKVAVEGVLGDLKQTIKDNTRAAINNRLANPPKAEAA